MGYETITDLIESPDYKRTPLLFLGRSPSRRSTFISHVYADMAIRAGKSFTIIGDVESYLLAACIKERSLDGHSLLRISPTGQPDLDKHVIEMLRETFRKKAVHIIINYPDDLTRFQSQTRYLASFIDQCISIFSSSLEPKPTQDSDETQEITSEYVATASSAHRAPYFLGDVDRYVNPTREPASFPAILSQARSLGYIGFVGVENLSFMHSEMGESLWAYTGAGRFILESDSKKASEISDQLSRYVDAEFFNSEDEMNNSNNRPLDPCEITGLIPLKNQRLKLTKIILH